MNVTNPPQKKKKMSDKEDGRHLSQRGAGASVVQPTGGYRPPQSRLGLTPLGVVRIHPSVIKP